MAIKYLIAGLFVLALVAALVLSVVTNSPTKGYKTINGETYETRDGKIVLSKKNESSEEAKEIAKSY